MLRRGWTVDPAVGFQAGGKILLADHPVQPYLAAGLGVSRFDPGDPAFDAENFFAFSLATGALAQGRIGELVLLVVAPPALAQEDPANVIYSAEFEDDLLTLTVVDDTCAARVAWFEPVSFIDQLHASLRSLTLARVISSSGL